MVYLPDTPSVFLFFLLVAHQEMAAIRTPCPVTWSCPAPARSSGPSAVVAERMRSPTRSQSAPKCSRCRIRSNVRSPCSEVAAPRSRPPQRNHHHSNIFEPFIRSTGQPANEVKIKMRSVMNPRCEAAQKEQPTSALTSGVLSI